tara:strand:- start:889 stop:2484 length:1596 start_codon:yes stop_codon:yes gene_type:complete
MAYVFPKRALKDQDVLDPIELNNDFIPAAQERSGKLNTNNISQKSAAFRPDFFTDGVSKTAYYSYHLASVDSNPGFGNPGAYSNPNRAASTTEHVLTNDMEWDVIESMSVSLTTTVSSLWVIGRVQYIWLGFVNTGAHTYSNAGLSSTAGLLQNIEGAKVQFAIRLNGNVLVNTITGEFDTFQNGTIPIRAEKSRSPNSVGPGSTARWTDQPTALSPECMSVRLGTTQEVPPGTHSVEIVARRIPLVDQQGYVDGSVLVEPNRIAVFNRTLFVLDLPKFPATTTTESVVDVGAYETEDLVTASNLGTERIYKVRDALNNIQPGALARGALSNYHLKSPVVAKTQEVIRGGSASFSNSFPGWSNNDTITTGTSASDNGWSILKDATGKKLQVLSTAAEPFDNLSTIPSVFLILANIHLQRVNHATNRGVNAPGYFAGFGIGVEESDGDEYVIVNSIGFVNHFATALYSYSLTASRTVYENCDVALCAVLKSSDVDAASLEKISVYGCVLNPQNDDVVAQIAHGSITVIRLRV